MVAKDMIHEGSARISVLGGKEIFPHLHTHFTWYLWGCTAVHAICTGSCITKYLKDFKRLYEEYIAIEY